MPQRWYLDTSAALKLIAEEIESDQLAATISDQRPTLVACALLETELRRAVARIAELSQSHATALLEGVEIYDVPASLLREAGLLPGQLLQSLDAIHLAAAIRLEVDHLVTYDSRMRSSARELGLVVLSPGGPNVATPGSD